MMPPDEWEAYSSAYDEPDDPDDWRREAEE